MKRAKLYNVYGRDRLLIAAVLSTTKANALSRVNGSHCELVCYATVYDDHVEWQGARPEKYIDGVRG